MKFFKDIKLLVGITFMIMVLINVVMYFYIEHSTIIFGHEVNCLYIQIIFILIELLFLFFLYGKKVGIGMYILYTILIVINLLFINAYVV